jgi:hypothetical protein
MCCGVRKGSGTVRGSRTAVVVIAGDGRQITGCVQHSARQLASMEGARLHPMAGLLPWALDIYCRAAEPPPFAWQIGL